MKRVLVVGGSGFIGQHLCRLLLEIGCEVVATFHRNQPRFGPRGTTWRHLDVRDMSAVRATIRASRCAWIVHLAGQSSTLRSFARPEETAAVNFFGSLNVYRAASETAECEKLLWVGSAEQYGNVSAQQLPIEESVGFAPCNPYAMAKAAMDQYIEFCCASFRLPVVRARLFPCTGPGQSSDFLCSDFARQVAAQERARASVVEIRAGNLHVVRDYTDVRDVCRGLFALLDKGSPGEAYNVCSGIGRTPEGIAQGLFAVSGRSGRIVVDPKKLRPADAPLLVGCNRKICSAIGWQPEIAWEQTLDDLLADWRHRLAVVS